MLEQLGFSHNGVMDAMGARALGRYGLVSSRVKSCETNW